MCLGIPGRVIQIQENPLGMTAGKVSFGDVTKDVYLAYLPDVQVGDYVLVHVGFAISKVDEQDATQAFAFLQEVEALVDPDACWSGSGQDQ